jgi:hypothetical protein
VARLTMPEQPKKTMPFRVSPNVLMRKVDDEFVLVHMGRNQIFTLNRTAARLWELMNEGQTRGAAIEQLTREFDVDVETARLEAEKLLRLLVDEDLAEVDVP